MSDRRKFLQQTLTVAVGASLIPVSLEAHNYNSKLRRIKLKENSVILFQGDSITDAGRNKINNEPNTIQSLGNGYAGSVAAQLLFDHAEKKLQIYNRGISGNKVYQLADRWDADCLQLKPDVLSIMVGVNDYWHTLTNNYKGTVQIYKEDYLRLIDRTMQTLPNVQLIIAEPYAIKGVKAVNDNWFPDFDEYRFAAKEIAEHCGALFIPTQQLFDKALTSMPGNYWTADGVHPSFAGVRIMSDIWLAQFK